VLPARGGSLIAGAPLAPSCPAGVEQGPAVCGNNPTHRLYGGALHPLLRDAEGQAVILTYDHAQLRRVFVGRRQLDWLVKLPPASSFEQRSTQLQVLGVFVAFEAFCSSSEYNLVDSNPVQWQGMRKHVMLPGGQVCPVFKLSRDQNDATRRSMYSPQELNAEVQVVLPLDQIEVSPGNDITVTPMTLPALLKTTNFFVFYVA
jgi:hypothetical protein